MLVAGFVVVAVLAVALFRLTRSVAEPVVATRAQPVPPVAAAPAPAAEPPPVVRESRAAAAPSRPRPRSTTERAPELNVAPPVSAPSGELKRDENGKLHPMIPVSELRAQLPQLEAPMKACLARSGQGATGKATLQFTVAARANKLVIESAGVQDEDTLVGRTELLDCMAKTASAFNLEGRPIPELGSPIYVRRTVRVENGELAENSIFDFSYAH